MSDPKVLLVVMDGWGYRAGSEGNAIVKAKTPTFDFLWNNYAHTLLNAWGENVGLPWGIMGSSEVGHTSIGSGKLINQELTKIDKEITDGRFYNNPVFIEAVNSAKSKKGAIHLIGMVSDGGVHSHETHLFAILKMLKMNRFDGGIFIHVFTDGRDTSPKSARTYLDRLTKEIKKSGSQAQIATVGGRYYAMDRDSNWDRVKLAYDAIVYRKGPEAQNAFAAIESQYETGNSDEFIVPTVLPVTASSGGFFSKMFKAKTTETANMGGVNSGDSVIFFNFRSERMRQITEMFLFKKQEIGTEPVPDIALVTMTTYDELLPVKVAYPTEIIEHPLARVLSEAGLSQGHFAETEKYAHVTFFFNGMNAKPFPNEKWFLVPSPKVKTYDLKPDMSANEITANILAEQEKNSFDFIMVNYANADMVGHTGVWDATVKAVETVDAQLKRLMSSFPTTTFMITADHGNAESMINEVTGEPDKNHSVNPIPFILVNPEFKIAPSPENVVQQTGILADIAPTVLHFYGVSPREEMTGSDLYDSLKPTG